MRNVDQVLTNRNILDKLFYANVCTKLNNGNHRVVRLLEKDINIEVSINGYFY